MEKISRRSVIGVAATALAGGVLAAEPAVANENPQQDKPPAESGAAAGGKTESPYKFRMGTAPAHRYGNSSIREHRLADFPMSSTISSGIIRLAKGDFREPHWHPNSDEWLFVMFGTIQMTVVNGKGEASHFECGPEDVAFIPIGFGHYVENVGDGDAQVLLIHNNADFTTVNLSDWVAAGSTSVFASTLNMATPAFDDVPTKRVFIGRKAKKA